MSYSEMFKTIELAGEDALDTVFRACHSLDRELRTRAASGAEVCLMACRDRLMQAGWRWDPERTDTVFKP